MRTDRLVYDDPCESLGRIPGPSEDASTGLGRISRILRWLGIIMPLVVSYPIVYPLVSWAGVDFGQASARVLIPVAAALWLGFTVALGWRRDWRGAGAITVFYLIVDAWWWLLALGVIRLD